MAFAKNITLLILSFSLLIAPRLAQPELSPAVSPSVASSPQSPSVPSPGPANGLSPNYVSFPPSTISDPPSASIAPTADAPGPSSSLAMSSPDDYDEPPTKLDSLAMSSDDNDDDDVGPAKLDSITTSSTDDGDDRYDSIDTSSTDDDDEDDEDPSKFDVSSILDTSSSTGDVPPNVKKICDSTDHASLCLTTIAPLLKGGGKDDVSSVLEASIGVGAKLSDYCLSLAKSQSEKPGTGPELLSVLKDCKDSYDTAVYNYQNAIDALHERDIGTMNSMLSAVITNVGDCEDGFSGIGEKSLFSGVSDKLTNVTSNCLAIVSLLG